jgi:actin-related protein
MSSLPAGIVVDFGKYSWKVGFTAEIFPRYFLSSPEPNIFQKGADESHWLQLFDFLKQDPTDTVVNWANPLLPKRQLESITQYLFETINIPAFQSADESVAAFLFYGQATGFYVNLGRTLRISVMAHQTGFSGATTAADLGGEKITQHLYRLLQQKTEKITISIANEIKENYAYVVLDPTKPQAKVITYTLPDGSNIELSDELYKCTEILFNPIDGGQSLQELIFGVAHRRSIKSIRLECWGNIILSGGTSALPNLAQRLKIEMDEYVSNSIIKTHILSFNSIACWKGMNLLATFYADTNLVTKQEYEEHGTAVIHRKSSVFVSKHQEIKLRQEYTRSMEIALDATPWLYWILCKMIPKDIAQLVASKQCLWQFTCDFFFAQ